MDRPVEVRTKQNADGEEYPVSCTLDGQTYQLFGVGRRWQAEDGEHLLVMFPRDRVVELLHCDDGTWQFVKNHSNLPNKLA